MKSRQKLSVSEKSLVKQQSTKADNYLEFRVNKKICSNPLLQKNINFLQTYNNILRKPSYGHIGDADGYFRQSLRNEPFDLIRDLHLGNLVKSAKSFDSISQTSNRRPRSKRTLLYPKKVLESHPKSDLHTPKLEDEELHLKDLYTPDIKDISDSGSDSGENEFFSPEAAEYFVSNYDYVGQPLEKVEETLEEEVNVTDNFQQDNVEKESEVEEEEIPGDIDKISDRLDSILKEVQEEDEQELGRMAEDFGESEFEVGGEEYIGFGDDEDDEMKEVEKMIERASAELADVANENKKIMDTLDEADEGEEGENSEFKYNSAADSAVLKELEDAERQAKETAKIIGELKERVMELSKKEKMTEQEAKELEQKNQELKKQMIIFEKKTKRIQELLAQHNLFENLGSFKPSRYNEDVLPKVVVCGMTENQMPKILICDDNRSKYKTDRKKRSSQCSNSPRSPSGPKPSSQPCTCDPFRQPVTAQINQVAQQDMCECNDAGEMESAPGMLPGYDRMSGHGSMQRPATLPGMGMMPGPGMMSGPGTMPGPGMLSGPEMMPEMLPGGPGMMPGPGMMSLPGMMQPQDTCECHQPMGQMGYTGPSNQKGTPRQMDQQLIELPPMDISDFCECGHTPKATSRPPTQPGRAISPGQDPSCGMPCGKGRGICPADIESRLQEYSENTQFLEKQLYDMEAEVKEMHQELIAVQKERQHLEHHRNMLCSPSCPPQPTSCLPPPCCPPSPCETQLRELREQYKRLQDDFKNKLTEVAGLRTENEKLKDKTKQAEDAKKELEKQVRDLEIEIKKMKGTLKTPKQVSKEQIIELEQQLIVAKQRFREAQDELDELRSLVDDQQKQLDDYRSRYLEAQQQVDEQRRQIDLMEMENQRISEQVNLEIQRVKNQFQEKLQELMPLPDILKSTQMKLQEAQQMHLLAERNNEAIARELQMYKDKIAAMTNQIDEVRSDQQVGEDAKAGLEAKIKELEEQLVEVQELNSNLLADLDKLTEKCDEYEKLADERLHEIVQLEAQLESLREETARQVARIKDRCEIVRRSMQKQIADLERQLAQSRALAKAAQKDRDDIRQKMQAQINNLNENFEDAQMRIRNLQGHVNFLRNSYGDVYGGDNNTIACRPPPPPDPCDCNPAY